MHCLASDWARPMHNGRFMLPHGTQACRAEANDQKCRGRGIEKFLFGGSFKCVWEEPTRSAKILQRVHGEM